MSPEDCTLKTRPTHLLKHDRPQSESPESCTLKTTNSHSVNGQPKHVSSEECILKGMLTHHLKKRMARVFVLEVCKIKHKKAYILKYVKAHHDHQNRTQEKERPDNEPPKEPIVNKEIAYSLRNNRFRRKLSEIFLNHLPTKKNCYKCTETM